MTVATGNQFSVGRHEIHETTKREFHGVEVFIDVRMIEFDVVDDSDFRQVVHELRAFVEIGRIVFVAFDDEVIAFGDVKTGAEVLHHAADHE